METSSATFSQEPTEHDRRAVPSAFRDHLGVRILEWSEGRCVIELPIADHLRNFSEALAGPVVSAAVDTAATLAGCYTPSPQPPLRAVTLSLTVSFVADATQGYVRAVATKVGGGRRIFTSTVTVTAPDGSVVATGQGTFRYIQEQGDA